MACEGKEDPHEQAETDWWKGRGVKRVRKNDFSFTYCDTSKNAKLH